MASLSRQPKRLVNSRLGRLESTHDRMILMVAKTPKRPSNLSIYGEASLNAVANAGLGNMISVGGGLGLLHYLDYRPTHDVDAWWSATATNEERQRVIDTVKDVLQSEGEVKVRRWGDVVSIELKTKTGGVFSFQIANRSAQLAPSVEAPWVGVLLDSFQDLVASKMEALVERGAPRDFRDVYELCRAGLTVPQECWQLWRQRQELAGSDGDVTRARLAIETHLSRISVQRPLTEIDVPEQREEAEQLRDWFTKEFLDALEAID